VKKPLFNENYFFIIAILVMCQNCARPNNSKLEQTSAAQEGRWFSAPNIDPACAGFSTKTNEARNVIRNSFFVPNDRFNLYWMGNGRTAISFWTDDGDNTEFDITRDPLMIFHLDNGNSGFRYICEESSEMANRCIQKFDRILLDMAKYQNQANEGKTLMDPGRTKTFECTQQFIYAQVQKLAREIRQNNARKNN
jgi:hypothetical protein